MTDGHPDLAGHRDGLARGEPRAQRCTGCGRVWWPPRPACPRCQCPDHAWTPLPDRGTLFTWTVVHHTRLPGFRDAVPYAVGMVDLPEAGVRVIGRITAPPGALTVGMPLRRVLAAPPGGGDAQPVWEPLTEEVAAR